MFENGQRPLFKGATRVPRLAGVPRTVALVIFMISATLFMTLHMWSLLVFAVLWSIAAALTKYDDRMFRILSLWLQTKFRNAHDTPFKQWSGFKLFPCGLQEKGAEINGGIA
ncbi:type IV secretion system protein VirB3 [Escherichia coli]|uniref:Type IV secretion system protein VirB3 n=1 Tax=Escherichia coli TaxID=562 RepID=A0A377BBK7_ECOLX|nr:type IV secretion system protein VirB3 [Escherichia coli]